MNPKSPTKVLVLGASCVLLTLVLMSCACAIYPYYKNQPNPVYVTTAPPEYRQESKTPSPTDHHVWVPGEWIWSEVNDKWEWVEGDWQIPPTGTNWVPGTYEEHGNQGIYTPGSWIHGEAPPTPEVAPSSTSDGGHQSVERDTNSSQVELQKPPVDVGEAPADSQEPPEALSKDDLEEDPYSTTPEVDKTPKKSPPEVSDGDEIPSDPYNKKPKSESKKKVGEPNPY